MDVTKENFQEVYDLISNIIHDADFVSIDTEFTGLDDCCSEYISSFDVPEERYQKLLKSTSEYLILQFGLTIFNKVSHNNYETKCFNFHIFPKPSKLNPDSKFSCQTSTIHFLSNHQFDFNLVFSKGINYLSLWKEKTLLESLMQKRERINQYKENNNNNNYNKIHTNNTNINMSNNTDNLEATLDEVDDEPINMPSNKNITNKNNKNNSNNKNINSIYPCFVPSQYQQFIDDQLLSIETLISSSYSSSSTSSSSSSSSSITFTSLNLSSASPVSSFSPAISSFSSSSLKLQPCSSYVRKLLYIILNDRYGDQLFVETVEKNCMLVTKVTSRKEKEELEERRREEELEELEKLVGFTKIIKLLHVAKKRMVGHHLLLDLMHLLNQFWLPLPQEYGEFKSLISSLFGTILDTKYLASTSHFKNITNNSTLSSLYEDLKNSKLTPHLNVVPSAGFTGFRESKPHNAGFDSYITGCCFLKMHQYLEAQNIQLDPFYNKLYLMKIFDVPYINLAGEDLPLNRNHVFHIQFQKNKNKHHIIDLFSPYGHIYLKLIDDQSAFISLHNEDQSEKVMNCLVPMQKGSWFKVQTFVDYQQNKNIKSEKYNPHNTNNLKSKNNFNKLKTSNFSKSINIKNNEMSFNKNNTSNNNKEILNADEKNNKNMKEKNSIINNSNNNNTIKDNKNKTKQENRESKKKDKGKEKKIKKNNFEQNSEQKKMKSINKKKLRNNINDKGEVENGDNSDNNNNNDDDFESDEDVDVGLGLLNLQMVNGVKRKLNSDQNINNNNYHKNKIYNDNLKIKRKTKTKVKKTQHTLEIKSGTSFEVPSWD